MSSTLLPADTTKTGTPPGDLPAELRRPVLPRRRGLLAVLPATHEGAVPLRRTGSRDVTAPRCTMSERVICGRGRRSAPAVARRGQVLPDDVTPGNDRQDDDDEEDGGELLRGGGVQSVRRAASAAPRRPARSASTATRTAGWAASSPGTSTRAAPGSTSREGCTRRSPFKGPGAVVGDEGRPLGHGEPAAHEEVAEPEDVEAAERQLAPGGRADAVGAVRGTVRWEGRSWGSS